MPLVRRIAWHVHGRVSSAIDVEDLIQIGMVALVEAGQKLWWAGDKSRNLPSCKSCHGPQGIGNGPAKWPACAPSHAVYTTRS